MAAHRVLVVGAGPAGMYAAFTASAAGAAVTLVDSSPSLGGQIWRGEGTGHPTATTLFRQLRDSAVQVLTGCSIIDAPEPLSVLGMAEGKPVWLEYDRLILATGARELFLPFPGWTLPNVLGVGGMQALVKGGLPVKRKRVVVAGSGPLLWTVAAYLKSQGAEVPVLAEQAPMARLATFATALRFLPSKIPEALGLGEALLGTGLRTGCYPVRVHGTDCVTAVTLRASDREWTVDCDYLACGLGFVPNLELPLLLGCALHNGFVAVDEWQQTSLPGVYAAGEPTGIGGAEKALAEGAIAGLAAAGDAEDPALARQAAPHVARRRRCHRFAESLERCFALRDELRHLPATGTIICRCEDVTVDQLTGHGGWRDAKLHQRLGMGHCQGRICGAATAYLYGWPMHSVRPPLFPASVEVMAARLADPAHDSGSD